ncbi:hypothetical protein E2C01_059497 [Portunus trituberculatus]|uniref:Uncharacterized protein n=1 Tax=Portunus trituberculatus TaxID=210409 RepID=A0A5B7H5I3_PORTR|nr:hypothetical protein [Portunus trituberculatus]
MSLRYLKGLVISNHPINPKKLQVAFVDINGQLDTTVNAARSSWTVFFLYFSQGFGMDGVCKGRPWGAVLILSSAGEEFITALYTNVHTCNPLSIKQIGQDLTFYYVMKRKYFLI